MHYRSPISDFFAFLLRIVTLKRAGAPPKMIYVSFFDTFQALSTIIVRWRHDTKGDFGMKNKDIKVESKQYILPKKKILPSSGLEKLNWGYKIQT